MKLQFIFILLLLISCSTKEQDNNTTLEEKDSLDVAMTDTSTVEAISTTTQVPEVGEEASKIHSSIKQSFKNLKKPIFKNEFGGGDCWGAYEQYSIPSESNTATAYKMECGEYSFTNYELVASEDNTPIFLRKVNYENDMDETTPDFIKEWIIDFQDTSKIYYRKYERVSYEVLSVPDSISFQEYNGEPVNIKEALSDIKSSKTAKQEGD